MIAHYIVIGGSAGSFNIIVDLLEQLPRNYPFPILLCLHRLKNVRKGFDEALGLKASINVVEPYDKQPIKAHNVYLAPANYHLLVNYDNSIILSTEETINHSRPSIDLTFASAAEVFKEKTIGVLLSGANKDGALGLKMIKDAGGITIVQDPDDAQVFTMPEAALNIFKPDYVLNSKEIINFIKNLHYGYA